MIFSVKTFIKKLTVMAIILLWMADFYMGDVEETKGY